MLSLPTKMELLRRLLTSITRRRQSTGQSTTGTHPPQAASESTTSMFHGVRTVFSIGGTFTTIVNGKPQLRASSSHTKYRAAPSVDSATPTHEGVNVPMAGTQTRDGTRPI